MYNLLILRNQEFIQNFKEERNLQSTPPKKTVTSLSQIRKIRETGKNDLKIYVIFIDLSGLKMDLSKQIR